MLSCSAVLHCILCEHSFMWLCSCPLGVKGAKVRLVNHNNKTLESIPLRFRGRPIRRWKASWTTYTPGPNLRYVVNHIRSPGRQVEVVPTWSPDRPPFEATACNMGVGVQSVSPDPTSCGRPLKPQAQPQPRHLPQCCLTAEARDVHCLACIIRLQLQHMQGHPEC